MVYRGEISGVLKYAVFKERQFRASSLGYDHRPFFFLLLR